MITWTRHPVWDTGYADYASDTGIVIRWCRHPTALRKYYIILPDGEPLDIYHQGGMSTFRTVREAKAAAEQYAEELT